MHWGNPSAPSTSDSKAVFSPADGWLGVWHLGQNAGTTLDGMKSASGVNDATGHKLTPESAVPARVGRGQNLDHLKNQGVEIIANRNNFQLAFDISWQVWAFIRSWGYNKGYETFMCKGDNSWRYMRCGSEQPARAEIWTDGTSPVGLYSKSKFEFGKWYFVTGEQVGKRHAKLFINDVLEDEGDAKADHVSYGDHAVTLGFSLHGGKEQRFMDAIIDEGRFSTVPRSNDWVKLDYQSMKEGSTFVTGGTVSTRFVPRTIQGWLPRSGASLAIYDLQGRKLGPVLKTDGSLSDDVRLPAAVWFIKK
jgi:hypothetical protein